MYPKFICLTYFFHTQGTPVDYVTLPAELSLKMSEVDNEDDDSDDDNCIDNSDHDNRDINFDDDVSDKTNNDDHNDPHFHVENDYNNKNDNDNDKYGYENDNNDYNNYDTDNNNMNRNTNFSSNNNDNNCNERIVSEDGNVENQTAEKKSFYHRKLNEQNFKKNCATSDGKQTDIINHNFIERSQLSKNDLSNSNSFSVPNVSEKKSLRV